MQDVDGKVAFITGGASGIGYGMAQVFLKNGMKVVIADNNPDYLAEARARQAGANNVHFIQVDVTDRAAMARAADEVVEVFGKVHVVCNNAGVGGSPSMDKAGYEDWDWMMGINFGGVVNGVISFLPKLKAHGEGGHIVNTSSMAGIIPLPGDGGIYTASKFAVRGLTESLRLTLAKDNIGVSVLCPGLTRSRIMEAAGKRRGASDEDAMFNSLDAGMDPVELGEAVLAGIRNNDPFILAHEEFKEEVQGLFDDIVALFPQGQDVPEDRRAFEQRRRDMTEAFKAGKIPG